MLRSFLSSAAGLLPRVCAARRSLVLLCLPLFATCLLLPAAADAQEKPYVAWIDPQGFSVTEGGTATIKIRLRKRKAASSYTDPNATVRTTISDDPQIDFVNMVYELVAPRAAFGPHSLLRVGETKDGSIEIPIQRDAICKDGRVTVSLVAEADVDVDHRPADGRYRTYSFLVKDDPEYCPKISLEAPSGDLERDGVNEGGTINFRLVRDVTEANATDGGRVTASWQVDDDSAFDFLAEAEQGVKTHRFDAEKTRKKQKKAIEIPTRVDSKTGNGSVKVTLRPSDYYKLTGKTTLTVPVKDDPGHATRVLRIQDITVAEDHLYTDSALGTFINGFRLPIRLDGNIATSGQDPSVRISLAEGGGCEATANAQDLSQADGDGGRVPRTSFPGPVVFSWDKERPEFRRGSFRGNLMNDQYHEGNETLCVRFDQPKFLRLPGGVKEYFATITITDDDPSPGIKVDAPSAAEGDGTLDFTVTLTNPPQGKAVTVKYHDTRKGSATSGDDYQSLPTARTKGVITFPADKGDGPQQSTVSVTLIDDEEVEDDEYVALRFTEARNADLEDGASGVTARGAITDNDAHKPQVRLREAAPGAGPVVVQEGATAVFHADIWIHEDGKWQIGALDEDVTIRWWVRDDQGSDGVVNRGDFPAGFGRFGGDQDRSVTIAAGQSGIQLEVPTLADSSEESSENFRVYLFQAYADNSGLIHHPANRHAAGIIYDGPTLRIAAPKGPATEGNRLKFPVTLGVAAATDISVAWKTESLAAHSAEAGKDYTAASGTLRFKAGEIDKVIRVATLEDSIDEPAEDFSVVLTDPEVAGLDLGPLRAVGIVRDNDKRPAIAVGDATANEGEALILPITLNPAPAVPVRLEWRVRAPDMHGATRGMDYTGAESGQLTFNAGESSKNLEFPTIDDSIDEPTETFEVALVVLRDEEPLFFTSQRDSEKADILAPLTATATILDNDTPTLSIDDAQVREGGKPVAFTVRLSSPRTYPVEVEFSTKDGGGPKIPTQTGRFVPNTALGAGPAQDYEGLATPRTVRFEPGTTQVKLPSIRVVDDDAEENSEYFQGVIAFKSGGADPGATIAKGVGLAKIRDNDSTRYWIANKDTTIREGRSVRIRVKRDRTEFRASGLFGCLLPTGRHDERGHAGMLSRAAPAPSGQIDVFIERKNNPVSACGQATDGATPAFFSFEVGEDEASFWVSTVDDRRKEPDETFIVWFDPTSAKAGDENSKTIATLARQTDQVEAQTVFTILDDDDIHRFRVVSANSPWEGEDAHFDIYVDSDEGLAALKKASGPFAEVKFGADSDTAKSNTHYTPGSNQRFFNPSAATSKSEPVGRISVPTFADDVLDGDKTLTLSIAELFAGVSTVLPFRPAPGGGSATATIRDDEAYHLSVLDAVGDEGDAAGVKVTLSKPVERDITIRFRTREGTAEPPGDFTACAAGDERCALVIPAGETEAQLRVPTTEDAVPEETEQFRVVIAEVDFADIIIDRRAAVVKIRDDDARQVAISGLADASAPENSAWTSPTPVWTGTPDGGVAWTVEGDDAARFTIDPDTGELTLPAQNFEAPADRDGDNVYDIAARVTDEDGNTAAVALSVTVTDVVYGQIDVNAGVPWTGRAIAGEGAPVRASFAYKPYGTQGDVAGRPGSVALRWRLGGLGGAGAASAGDLALSGAGGPASLQYKAGAASLVELARTLADTIDELAVETFRVELSADNDDVVFHDAVSGASTTTPSLNLDFGIRDGFAPALVINRQSLRVQESDIASTRAKENQQTYRVKLNFAPVTDATVAMSLPPETTRIALDKSSLTFTSANWSAWQTVKVSAVDDSIENDPPAEEIRIGHSVTGAGGLDVAAGSVTVSVYDDDAPNIISIDSPSVTEGDSGDTDITWTVTLQRPARENIVLFAGPNSGDRGTTIWHSSGGKLDHRFGFRGRVLNFNVGDSRKTFGTKVIGDVRYEGDETIKLQVTVRHLGDGSPFATGIRHPAPQNPQTGYAYALVTGEIADDDDAPDGIAFTLTPSETKSSLGDTATSTREDRGTRSLTAQAAVLGDTTYGEDKTVTITVGADGDSAVAGTDYTTIDPIEITIDEGEASASAAISLSITDDTLDEADEAITFTPEADDSGIDIAAATHTITDDDDAPTVSVGDATAVTEGDDPETTTDMTFTVTLSAASGRDVTVPYTLTGTATADDDYDDPATKSMTIAAGATTADITIAVTGDEVDEPNETVVVTLGSPTNATVSSAEGAGAGTGTITDDDTATLSIADAAAAEGATATFTVTLSTPSASSVTVTATTSEGTATDPEDYTHKAGALTFAAGQTSKDFTVAIASDTLAELDETFTVTLSGATGATIADATATGTITGADALLAVADASAAEGEAVTFTVTRAGDIAKAATVQWTTGDDTTEGAVRATAGADYTARTTAQTLAFKAGESTATFTVATTEDAIDEPDETFAVTLASPSAGTALADAAAIGTITDDDDTPTATLLLTPATINESGATNASTVTASLSAASSEALTLTVSAGAGVTSSDNNTLTIAAGATTSTGTVTLTADDNAVDAADLSVTVSATASGGNGVANPANQTLTVADDDIRGVSVSGSALTLAEADNAATENTKENEATYTVVLDSKPAAGTVTVAVNSADTKTATVSPSSVTFTTTDWSTPKTVTVTAGDDDTDNANDKRTVRITHTVTAAGAGNDYGSVTADPVTVTVNDDDSAPTVSVGDATAVTEGDDPETTTDMTFTVTLSAASGKTVTVPYALSGTAEADDDYDDPATKSVTIAAGQTTGTIAIAVKGDETDESNETVIVTLGAPTNATVSTTAGAGTATGTITDDDATPTATLVLTPATIDESGATNASAVTATLSAATSEALTLTVSAGAGVTVSANKLLTIAAGATASTGTVTLTAVDNARDNADLEVAVSATKSGGNAVAAPDAVTLTVTDDDGAPTVSVGDAAAVTEGDDPEATANMTFTVTLSAASGRTVTVPYALTGTAEADDDYADPATKSVTITAGDTEADITIAVRGDEVDEPNETVIVTLGAPTNATVSTAEGAGAATGVITDDDTATLSIADAAAAEGATATFTVTLSTPSASPVTVAATTSEGTATDPEDYTHKTEALTFAAGETSKDFTVAIASDTLAELDETFTVTLSGATGATIADATATGTITGADALLAVADASAAEGEAITFTVTRTGDTAKAASVQWTTGDDTTQGADKAAAGADYTAQATAATLSFKAGESTATFTVATTEDAVDEPNETFAVTLASPSAGLAIADAAAIGTITDDDATPTALTLTVDADTGANGVQTSVAENGGAKTARVTATLASATTFATATTVTVAVGAATDSATEGTDYAAVADLTITIAAGQSSGQADFTLTPTQDALAEGTEAISLGGTAAGLTVTGATLTLTDDDDAPTGVTLSVSPAAVGEGAGETEVTVTATVNGATRYPDAKTVRVTVGGGTATAGTDYAAVAAFDITIAAGAASAQGTFDLTPTDDDVDEANETIDVTGAATGVTVTKATLSLTDDDTLGVTVTPASKALTLAEADNGDTDAKENEATYTVVLDSQPTADVTVAITNPRNSPVTLDKTSLTFTTEDWNTARTVTVTAADDDIDNAGDERAATLAHDVSGGGYGQAQDFDVAITVADDDGAPDGIALSVNPASVAENAAAAATVTVTATVTGGTTYADATALAITVGDSADSAVSGTDYAAVNGFNISIPAGAASATGTFDLDPTDDAIAEGAETLTVSGAAGDIAVTDATVTLTDDEGTPTATLVLTPATINESGADNASAVTATLSAASGEALTLTVSAGAGVTPSDNKTLTIAAGATTSTGAVTLTAIDNDVDAADLEVAVSAAASGGNGVAAPASVTLTVADDDTRGVTVAGAPLTLDEVDDGTTDSVAENAGSYTVALMSEPTGSVTVAITNPRNSPVTLDKTTLTFTTGTWDTAQTVTVTALDDDLDNAGDQRTATLAHAVSGGGYGAAENFAVSVTVADDDGAPMVSVGDAAAVAEGDDPDTTADMTFTVTLSAASGKTVTVPYALSGSATADDDYDDPAAKSVTIAAGQTTGTITIPVKGDETDELNETVIVTLGNPTNATVSTTAGAGTATGTITDDDAAALSIADATAAEGATATFTVTLSTPSASPVTVAATTSEGTATDPEDYTHKTEALTFAAGETSKDFTVAIKRDTLAELDETFTVTLSGATGATIADATATGTITGADALLAVADASAAEGEAITFTVTRTGDTAKAASVQWTTGDDTTQGADKATAGADYTAQTTAQTLSFKAGDATATFTVATTEDAVDEPDETFAVTLASPSAGTAIADGEATGTITDDDGAPTVSVANAADVTEGDDPEKTTDMTFTVTLSAASGKAVTVPYTISGSATADDDYDDPAAKSVTIATGQTTADIVIPVKGDETDEANETVIVTLGTPTNATIASTEGAGTATGTITDDDTRGVTVDPTSKALTLAETDNSATENAKENEASYTVALMSEPTGSVTVAITNPRNSPVALDKTSLTFTAATWDDPQTVTVTAVDDAIDNTDDKRAATLAHAVSGGGYGAAENFDVDVTVTDDDAAPTALTLTVDADTGPRGCRHPSPRAAGRRPCASPRPWPAPPPSPRRRR